MMGKVKNLENVTYISLDTFKEKNHNEIETELDAWLTFFTAEEPEDVLRLINSHPEFLPMYQEITEFRKDPAEVIGMFSEELRILDRNTTKYMIDELHEQVEAAINENKELKKENVEQAMAINKHIQTIDLQAQTIEEQAKTIELLKMQLAEQKE